MLSMMSYYFSTLMFRLIVLLLCCSFIPLFLLANNYPVAVITPIFVDILCVALPWFLWFHQTWLSAFFAPSKSSMRWMFYFVSICLSTIITMLIFPLAQKNITININSILPNIVAPNYNIIPTKTGTLVIDPQNNEKLFTKKSTKAVWIDQNYVLFQDIQTNQQDFVLSTPETFTSFGYYPQKGTMKVSFTNLYPELPKYQLGQYIVQTWYDNIMALNAQIETLYKIVNVPLPTPTQRSFTNIRMLPSTNTAPEINKILLPSDITNPKITIPSIVISYLNIFSVLFCVFSVATVIGALITLGQHFLGALALLLIVSLYAPHTSINLISVSFKLQEIYPTYSLMLINLGLSVLLSFIYIITSSMKNSLIRS